MSARRTGPETTAISISPGVVLPRNRWISRVQVALAGTLAATVTLLGLTTGPVWAADFTRGAQSFSSASVSSVGGAASAFADNAGNWSSGGSSSGGDEGDWSATDLSSAGAWTQGGGSGAYSYTYSMRVPPAAGPVPEVGLSYSSAAHDGLTSGTNNQASWIGDGWGYSPGFIERTYTSCATESEQDGNNGTDPTGDLCWDGNSPSITLSLSGSSSALVLDDASGEWRAASDANWRIEKLGSSATASAATTERWKVTTTDGTQYFFAADAANTGSRWTVPVFGNHSGEPCYVSGDFAASRCTQAYRWLLDEAVDVHGNKTRYVYGTETGYYAPTFDSEASTVGYTRSGWLKRIEYGLRDETPVATNPTGRIQFLAGDRCVSDCYTNAGDPKESNWPDVPWDLECDSGTGCEQYSPVFYSTKRLSEITTEVWNPATGVLDPVDSWTLTHEIKDYGDNSQKVLWLSSIQHTGHVGGTEASMPKVEFGGTFLPNTVDDGSANPMIWRPRLTSVKNETGGVTTINYSQPECGEGNLPTVPESNTKRCYPAWYTPEGTYQPVEAYFHKYVVASVAEADTTAGADPVWTTYEYSTAGGGANVLWAWNDSEFTADDKRTYNQWRGYAQLTTLVGDPADPDPQLRSVTRYYRGLDGQPLPDGGEREVTLTSTRGDTAVDHEALAGQAWEQVTYENTTAIASSINRYWTKNTATRTHDGGELKAWMTGPSAVETRTKLSATAWQTTRSTTQFDAHGRAVDVTDEGNVNITGDEQCVHTEYVDNTTAWIFEAPSQIETFAVTCDTEPSRPGDVISDVRAYYDGKAFGAEPRDGLMTKSEILDSWNGGPQYKTLAESTYDALGRATASTDALGATTTTAYTPTGAGPVTQVAITNALGHAATATFQPAWGVMLTATNPNGQVTSASYDALGRRTAVWLPGQSQTGGEVPNLKFTYTVSDSAPSATTTETMIWDQSYLTEISIYDALMRPRQTQAETYGGRLVTQVEYNSKGQVLYESGANFNNESGPTTGLVRISRSNDVSRTEYVYDDAGRVTDQIFVVKDEEKWRTTKTYGGNDTYALVTTTAPEGASAAAALTDARGNIVEAWRYHDNTPTGIPDVTAYTYTDAGKLATVTDPDRNVWTFGYDLRGRQTSADDPDTGHSTTTYNNAGQVTSTTTSRTTTDDTTLSYKYDVLGRQTELWQGAVGSGTKLSEWTYDTATNGKGLPHKAINWVDDQAWTQEIRAYTPEGWASQTYTTLPASAGTFAGSYWQAYTYHPDGSMKTSRAIGAAGLYPETMIYGYNEMGQASRVSGTSADFGAGKIYVDAAVYSPYGQLLQRRLGDPADVGGTSGQAWQTWIYEEGTGRLAEFYFDKDTAGDYDGTNYGIAALSYDYDDAGNIVSITDEPVHTSEALAPETQCFQYDGLQRLTEAWSQSGTGECAATPTADAVGGPASYWSSYDYDTTGNRTSESRWNGSSQTAYTYSYAAQATTQPHALDEVTSTANGGERTAFTYDKSGYTTSIDRDGDISLLEWTPTGRLDTVRNGEDTTRLIDDANGNRLARIDPDGSITAWVAGYELHYDATAGTKQATRYYTHGGETVCVREGKGDILFLSGDHHGTGQWIVNGDTLTTKVRRYDPFGNDRSSTTWVERDGTYGSDTWPDERGFVGGIDNKGIGLTTIGAREYDPLYGRFISVDPIADFADPQQLNGYAYALNNPVTLADPTGLSVTPPQEGMIPTWCGGSPVDCTGWHWPEESKTINPTPGADPDYFPEGTDSNEDGVVDWETEWTFDPESYAQCAGANNYVAAGGVNFGVFGTCLPPLPVDASHDSGAFMLYCLYYGITTDGTMGSCSGLANFAGLEVDSGIVPQTTEEFIQTILDLTIVGDLQDCGEGQLSGCGWAALDIFGGKIIKWGGDIWEAARIARKACNSFIAGTLVLMADGTAKPIEDVEPGDEVLSADVTTGEVAAQVVSNTMTTPEQLRSLVTIDTDADGDGTGDGEITATAGHVFWTAEAQSQPWRGDPAEWKTAAGIEPGAWFQTSAGSWVQTVSVAKHFDEAETHGLSVNDTHTFFVESAVEILVHNQDACEAAGDFVSRGSTGRTVAGSAEEEEAMEYAKEYASYGEVLSTKMEDPRWNHEDGWVKMKMDINGIEIHYVYNSGTGQYDDFKFKDWSN